MRTAIFALALLLAPLAHAQNDDVCYAWLSLSPEEITAKVEPIISGYIKDHPEYKPNKGRIIKCYRGVIESRHVTVRQSCLDGFDPAIDIDTAMLNAERICLEQSSVKPTVVFPPEAQ